VSNETLRRQESQFSEPEWPSFVRFVILGRAVGFEVQTAATVEFCLLGYATVCCDRLTPTFRGGGGETLLSPTGDLAMKKKSVGSVSRVKIS